MAVKSLYFKNVTTNGALSLQDGGTAPTAAITTTGWAVGKIAVSNYSIMLAGTEKATGTFSTTNALTTPAFSASSCWRSENPFTGTFANTNWTLAFRVRAVSAVAAQAGRILCRLWKSANADGSGAVELTSAVLSGTVTSTLSTTASQTSTVTWTPGSARVFDNEYLWVQCEWMITTLGTNNSADVDFYIESAGLITTPDFVAAITGTGALSNTANPATLASAGISRSIGTGDVGADDSADIVGVGEVLTPAAEGTGALAPIEAALAGSGTAVSPATGTGTLDQLAATLSGVGLREGGMEPDTGVLQAGAAGIVLGAPAVGPTAPNASILASYTPGSDRNDFTGAVGVRLGIGNTPIPVKWIGARRHHANQTGLHTVNLYEWFSQAVVRTAVIDYTGVAVGSYAWTAIEPITLPAGSYYALLMDVTAFDGQTWCNPGPASYVGMANIYDCYWYGGLQTGGAGASFIGLDLGQNVGPEQTAFASQTPAYDSSYSSEFGGWFTFATPGVVTGVRYWFVATSSLAARRINAWDPVTPGVTRATAMGPVHDGTPGWKVVPFGAAVQVEAGKQYNFSCNIPDGYPRTDGAAHPVVNGDVTLVSTTFSASGPNTQPTQDLGSYLFTDVVFRSFDIPEEVVVGITGSEGGGALTSVAATMSGRPGDTLISEASTLAAAGMVQTVYSGNGALASVAAITVASGTGVSTGTAILPSQVSAITCSGAVRQHGPGVLADGAATIVASGTVSAIGTAVLTPIAVEIAASGKVQTVYSGPGVLTSTATMAASGKVTATGSGALPVPAQAAITAAGVSFAIASGVMTEQAATVTGAGTSATTGTGTTGSVSASMAAAGTSQSVATAALLPSVATVSGSEVEAYLGGKLRAGIAIMIGVGTSSASGKGTLLPQLAA